MAKLKNSPIAWKISVAVTDTLVLAEEEEYFMYKPSKITFNQYDISIARAPPTLPQVDLNTITQQSTTWKAIVMQELTSIGITRL